VQLGGEAGLPRFSDVILQEGAQILVNLWLCAEKLNPSARI
jgi:hypothetical protein